MEFGSRPGLSVLVVVPARDEVQRIESCVTALAVAVRAAARAVVVVVDNGSDDGTAAAATRAARAAALPLVVAPSRGRTVGEVRNDGVGVALRDDLVDPRKPWWLLSTDADTQVDPTWVDRVRHHSQRGARAVAGVVDLLDEPDADDVRGAFASGYRRGLSRDGTHTHVHAANVAVRLEDFLAVGGFPHVIHGEEHGLWRRLRAHGVQPVSDTALTVRTSARRDHRAALGFGAGLQAQRARLGVSA